MRKIGRVFVKGKQWYVIEVGYEDYESEKMTHRYFHNFLIEYNNRIGIQDKFPIGKHASPFQYATIN